jgi:hypothetical protein
MYDRLGFAILATQNVAVGSSSTQSTALGAQTRCVRLVSNTDCYIAIGSNPTATTSGLLLLASQPEYFTVRPGELIAVIQSSASGTLNVAEMGR